MKDVYTVAIIGVGCRGGDTYGRIMNEYNGRYKIVALCDISTERLERFSKEFGVEKENLFTDENEFFKVRRADVLVIGTQDKDHYRQALKAFKLKYDVLLEKPITDKKRECIKLLKAQKKSGSKTAVGHVLRYSPSFMKVKELLESGKIGRLVAINALERVIYWHQAHSFVRGHWRNSNTSCAMILAKCCHDLDLLQYYAKSKCKTISSIGDLVHFKKENAPEGATERCLDCPHCSTCPYSAKKFYIDDYIRDGMPKMVFFNALVNPPHTIERLENALRTGPYGRCVYFCDNNVVDHQLVNMEFENGVKASLTMTGFTADGCRRYNFFGTHGEILLDGQTGYVELKLFTGEVEKYDIKVLDENGYGHAGGDFGLVTQLTKSLDGDEDMATTLTASIESHLMGILAEKSRIKGGKCLKIH